MRNIMKFIKTEIDGVIIVEPTVFEDARGYFFESYNEAEFSKNGITNNIFLPIKKSIFEMIRKIRLLLIKARCYLRTRYLMSVDTKRSAFIYALIIIVGLLLVHFIKIDFNVDVEHYKDYYDLFTNTGVALIGLSGIVFTLQIFNQESQNNYMNSVMEKIVDIRAQHIVEYIYLCSITFIFLIISKTGINISECIRFYYDDD